MKYDFETAINRTKQGSAKWNGMKNLKNDVGDNIYPFSVADSDLATAPEIVEGLKDFLDEAPLGYTMANDDYYSSVMEWMKKRHNVEIEKEWIVLSSGVVTALYNCVNAFTKENDSILIMSPVYYPFRMSIENNHRKVVESSLVQNGTTYVIDFEDFEEKASRDEVKMFILCNPHNPIGAVWTKEELSKISEICLKHNVLVISDEIHLDLIMPGHEHFMYTKISEEAKQNCVVCTAPSKTFNLAGLQTSNIFIPNEKLRTIYVDMVTNAGFHTLNIMGMKACELAYTKAEVWLDEFLVLIEKNHQLIKEFMNEKLPMITVFDLQGTYLQWLDFNVFGFNNEELEDFMINDCELFLDEGYIFGKEGNGFERINLACPTTVLQEGLDRLYSGLVKKGLLKINE